MKLIRIELDNGFYEDITNKTYEKIYNKAIDDYNEKLMQCTIYGCMLPDGFRADVIATHTVDYIAEQLKESKNDRL